MTDTLDQDSRPAPDGPDEPGADARPSRRWAVQATVAIGCAVLGFLLVAQVRATETVSERLVAEREEDLAVILSDVTTQNERLQSEITDLRLLLFDFESTRESEGLVLRNVEKRLDDLRILSGVVPAESEGVVLTIDDPTGQLGHNDLLNIVHEMRNAGAEAIAVNNVRLVAQSSFATRNDRLVVDGQPLESPYRIAAVGPSDELISSGLEIPGGALQMLEEDVGLDPSVERLDHLTIPSRDGPVPFVYGEPVPPESDSG